MNDRSNDENKKYVQSFISAEPADLNSKRAEFFKNTLPKFPSEAIYIYSFLENRMIYSDGWESVTGMTSKDLNMQYVLGMSAPEHIPFTQEINDKAMYFIHTHQEDYDGYSFVMEFKVMHQDGSKVPVRSTVSVFESDKANLISIMGRFQVDKKIRFGKVLYYQAFGPHSNEFEEDLNKNMFTKHNISHKEIEALALASKGYTFKEIAQRLEISPSAIEKRILPLYKRFSVKSLPHLVSYAYDNHILPV